MEHHTTSYYQDEEVDIFYTRGHKTSVRFKLCIAIFGTLLACVVIWAIVSTVIAVMRQNQPYPNAPVVDDNPFTLDIISYNDVYELDPKNISTPDKRGGASRALAYINSVRQKKTNPGTVLVLSGGDMISPSLMSTIFKGKQMIDANNLMGLNFSAIGNHEFDFDVATFTSRYYESTFKWINSNIQNLPFNAPENVIYDFIPGKVRIGLFGVCLQFGPTNTTIVITDPIAAATEQVAKLRKQGATYIIALTHLPADQNCAMAKVNGIDLIISGHDHQAKMNKDCGDAVYVTASQDWQDLWHIRVNFNYSKPVIDFNSVPITFDNPTDSAMDALIKSYQDQIQKQFEVVIAKTTVALEGRSSYLRTRETNLGDYISDGMRQYAATNISYFNGGGIRCNKVYPANSDITKGNVIEMLPFSNHHAVLLVNGTVLKQMLENGVSTVAEVGGRFPLISGFRVNFTLNNPVGSRIISMQYPDPETKQYVDIQPYTTFTMCTSEFLVSGGDEYSMVTTLPRILGPDQGQDISAITMDFMQQDKIISQTVDGRLTQV